MIFTRYLAQNMIRGSALVLLILVSLNLFFTLIQQIDNLGRGEFGPWQFTQYLLLRIPNMVVEFMPLATLLGSILSLGSLASNSELIAFQSAGLSFKKLIVAVIQIAAMLAIMAFVISDFVVPYSETTAREIKASAIMSRVNLQSRNGVWIKDGHNILFIRQLYPDGNAQNIEIYHLDKQDKLVATTVAQKALYTSQGWLLQNVKKSLISTDKITLSTVQEELYSGKLSDQLLQSLVVDPRQMSSLHLYGYIQFLNENNLNHAAESLTFWQKIYSPLTVIVMALLAIPYVLGSQRNSNTGQRIMTGILLGLVYVILNRLLIQLGEQLQLAAFINALIPTLIFMVFTGWMIHRKMVQL
ncbi:MAG: LPS export ABC transporter permease LptG [Gammaproteobacteria bacterium]|nr:LPS export ABC transporter permease LptG [Gammaproteobacteria bacterium]